MERTEIHSHTVYTTREAGGLLKISESTMKRLLKSGMIKANKVGRQYRILGLEILRLLSPSVEKRATHSYLKIKKRVVAKINKW